jgi:gliding motility-associated-like protein
MCRKILEQAGLVTFFILSFYASRAQDGGRSLWTRENIFEHKAFIENKGQFNVSPLTAKGKYGDIKYAVTSEGMEIYFRPDRITYRHLEAPSSKDREEMEEGEQPSFCISQKTDIIWIGANANAEIAAEDVVDYYFTYPDPKDKTGKKGIQASAYKKITLKQLYPGVDVEYSFPEGKKGIKYTLIIHPGADPSLIKMKYSGAKINEDEKGNIIIAGPFGNIIDHAPVTFYQDNNELVKSSFKLEGNVVAFHLEAYDHSRTVIIDPWTINPAFQQFNSAYEVDFDLQGNVYVYGGAFPWQAMKFNSAGSLVWIFTTYPFTNNTPYYYYGDFAIDRKSQSCYISEGLSVPGAKVIKLNANGNQAGMSTGIPLLRGRILYDDCNKQLIMGGGGKINGSYQAMLMDTNVSAFTPVNVLGTQEMKHDIALMCIDNAGNCFMATARSDYYTTFDNVLLKCPSSSLSPLSYMIPDNYTFTEGSSISYVMNSMPTAIGFNGITVSNNHLFTFDGKTLKRWNKNTGTFINSSVIGSQSFRWGGLASDECANVYAGIQSTIIKYDSLFNFISIFSAPDNVYDVKLGPGNILYACGRGFLATYQVSGNYCSGLNLTATVKDSCGYMSANATVTGGTPAYTYFWSTNPVQTTATASGLASGTYTVIVRDAACVPHQDTAIVVIPQSVPITTSISGPTTICSGQNSTLLAANGNTYSWSNNASTSAITVSPTATTTYSVVVTNSSGCTATSSITVIVNPVPVVSLDGIDSICKWHNTVLTAGGGGTYLWSTGETSQVITVSPLVTTTYTVNVSNGLCTASSTIKVFVKYPTIHATASAMVDGGIFTQLNSTGGGTYYWSPPDGLTCLECPNPVSSPEKTTRYCVTVTDEYGCTDSACIYVRVSSVYIPNAFTPNANGNNDLFKPQLMGVRDYKFWIFNRWGERIFETTNLDEGWDGRVKDELCPEGVYVYRIHYIDDNESGIHDYCGRITLVR